MARTTRIWRFLSTHQDVPLGLGLIAACAVLFWMTGRFPEVPAILSQNVPPTFFPRLVLAVMTFLSLLLILRGLTTTSESQAPVKGPVFLTAAIIVTAIVLMEWLGMLITVSILAVVMPLAWGERRYCRLAVLAVALPVAIHLTFTLALGIRFPLGVLERLLS